MGPNPGPNSHPENLYMVLDSPNQEFSGQTQHSAKENNVQTRSNTWICVRSPKKHILLNKCFKTFQKRKKQTLKQ